MRYGRIVALACVTAVALWSADGAGTERGVALDPATALERQRLFYERLLVDASLRERVLRTDMEAARQLAQSAQARVAGLEATIATLTQTVAEREATCRNLDRIARGWQSLADGYAASLAAIRDRIAVASRRVDGNKTTAP